MSERKKMEFAVFLVNALAKAWKMSPQGVYRVLAESGALDGYIWPCSDVLHSMGREALVEDLTEYARERGYAV